MANDSDIAKIEYVIKKADDIKPSGKTRAYTYSNNGHNKTADTIRYEKKIGNKVYYAVQAVADTKAKTLYIVTAYMGNQNIKKEVSQLTDTKNPSATSKNGSVVTSSDYNISHSDTGSQDYYMQQNENNPQAIDGQEMVVEDGGDVGVPEQAGEDDMFSFREPEGSEITKPDSEIYDLSKNILPSTKNRIKRKKLTLAEKQTVRKVGEALDGTRVEFFETEQYAKENNIDLEKVPDSYEQNGVIYINESAENPLSFLFGHEFFEVFINKHTSQNDKGELVIDSEAQEMINAVLDNKGIFLDFVKSQGFSSSLQYVQWIAENRTQKGDTNFVGKSGNEKEARAGIEAVANFIGEKCSSDVDGLIDFANTMNAKQGNKFIEFVKNAIAYLKSKLQGLTGDRKAVFDYELSKIESKLASFYQNSKSKIDDRDKHFSFESENKNTADGGSVSFSINSDFYKRLENWDRETTGFSFVLGTTSDILISAGIPKKQIRMDATKVKTLLSKHSGMDIESISKIPELLENPIVILDSKNNENSKIVMGDLYDANGKIVTVVLLMTPTSKKGNVLDIIKISSSEGRSHIESLFRNADGSMIPIRYYDKNRIQDWLNVNRLRLPLHSFNPDSDNSIHDKSETVNSKNMQKNENNSPKHFSYSDRLIGSNEESGIDLYTESRYNNYGWVRANDVLTAAEYGQFSGYFADHKIHKNYYVKTKYGDSIIPVGKKLNVLVYASGGIKSPKISKVVRINEDNDYSISQIRGDILENEKQGCKEPFRYVQIVYGEGSISIDKRQDLPSFQRFRRQREGNVGTENSANNRAEQNGRGNVESNTENEAGLNESAFSVPEKHFSYYDTPSSLLDRYDNGEITREQMEEILSGKRKETLKDIADLTPEDASTTPQRARKTGKAKGDKISNTYDSLLESDIFDDTFKDEVKTDEFVMKYESVTNKEILKQASDELDAGGQTYVNKWWVTDISTKRVNIIGSL